MLEIDPSEILNTLVKIGVGGAVVWVMKLRKDINASHEKLRSNLEKMRELNQRITWLEKDVEDFRG